MFQVPPYGSGEHNAFEVAAFANQVVHRIAVRNSHDVLFNDGPVIEDIGHVMTGSANELHSPFESPMIGLASDERRQEGMMDVDDAVPIGAHEFVGENL